LKSIFKGRKARGREADDIVTMTFSSSGPLKTSHPLIAEGRQTTASA
jgi:hypothetical protein